MRASLVPAYNQCTSPNRVHGPPDFPGNASNPDGSCNPPVQTSGQLTVGSPDANGAGGELGRLGADVGDQRQPGDHRRRGRRALQGIDHRRALQARRRSLRGRTRPQPTTRARCRPGPALRITDRYNGPSEVGTGQDTSFGVTVPCTGTAEHRRRLDLLGQHDRRRGAARRGEGEPALDLAARPGAGIRRRSRRRRVHEPEHAVRRAGRLRSVGSDTVRSMRSHQDCTVH